ncbi:molybdenum cofactor biosysynthesis protein [Mycobacterium sp. 852002-50816_SCH5313054-b]|uniref:MOSC domain-containing protein n=1 Tax=Mycobacterium sp. 852002-50816_SCH5313054-b TaxID=1834092 RepID=UPI0007FDF328|nr:MOSC N-terminal beta barrel domain-containing protein [Mycobacterium sp. 852002-50816_SCH5313054-b]OBF47489.1 molybdenum cofactor biosysynthesis protein [Mycobacterium sp. 852002-50816_SCH5313054-b]
MEEQLRVASLRRYPVKSMLGESVDSLFVDEGGAEGDRRLALIDTETGHVASAKHARLWRGLLKCTANADTGRVSIRLPDGTNLASDDPGVDDTLSRLLGRTVRLVRQRPAGATLERPDPEKLLELGLDAADAEAGGRILEIAQATPGDSFTDEAPLHAISTATLDHIGVEALRYRPNLVIATPPGYPPYGESDWIGRELVLGEARLRALTSTSRCVVPTLEHGPLPRAPQALRTPAAENRWNTGGHGPQPCAGAYLEVLSAGVIRVGDPVTLGP